MTTTVSIPVGPLMFHCEALYQGRLRIFSPETLLSALLFEVFKVVEILVVMIRKKWDHHEYVIPVTADLEFLNEARRPIHGDRFETLYRAWRFAELDEQDLRAEFPTAPTNSFLFTML